MLRFLPDGWLEWLLRPFLMADPVSHVYIETMAPDWRPGLLLVFLIVALVAGRLRGRVGLAQGKLLVGFLVSLCIWTTVVGNGRYFVSWLLVIGPLLVLAIRCLPGSASLRWLILGMACAIQGFVAFTAYNPDGWMLTNWVKAPGIDIEASPLQTQPAVFATIGAPSFSILVPRFHPDSRWTNLAGQVDLRPGMPEFERARALLHSPLPKYLLIPATDEGADVQGQPSGPLKRLAGHELTLFGVGLIDETCPLLRSTLAPGPLGQLAPRPRFRGFWFCALTTHPGPAEAKDVRAGDGRGAALDDVFTRIEQRCPKFFPPGGGNESQVDGLFLRHYTSSDVKLYIDSDGYVLFRYFRAMNPTVLGTVDQIRQDQFSIACDKLPGRYQFPWQRG